MISRKSISSRVLTSLALAAATLAVGCNDGGVGPGPVPGCAAAVQTFVNSTPEDITVTLTGPDSHQVPVLANSTTTDSYAAGRYTATVQVETGQLAGIVVEEYSFTANCGQSVQTYTLHNNLAVLELTNGTNTDLWITIDGEVQNLLEVGQTAQYLLDSDYAHRLKVEEDLTGSVIFDDDADNYDEWFDANTFTPFTIVANLPIVQVENLSPEGSGCIYAKAYVPGASSSTVDWTVFENLTAGEPTYEVCPGETGYFALSEENYWTIEFFDADGVSLGADPNVFFYNNTTTIYTSQ